MTAAPSHPPTGGTAPVAGLDWAVVVPVKATVAAKSRLDPDLGERRPALARAFVLDTVVAIARVPAVRLLVVVTADHAVRTAVRAKVQEAAPDTEVRLVDEPPGGGLNAAAAAGAAWVRTRHGDLAVAVVPADLPALRTRDAADVLRQAAAHPRGVVPDREAMGTTVLTALPGVPLVPRFGPDSLRQHRSDGAVVIGGAGMARARRDVDTAAHLAEAVALGVGPETTRALAD